MCHVNILSSSLSSGTRLGKHYYAVLMAKTYFLLEIRPVVLIWVRLKEVIDGFPWCYQLLKKNLSLVIPKEDTGFIKFLDHPSKLILSYLWISGLLGSISPLVIMPQPIPSASHHQAQRFA